MSELKALRRELLLETLRHYRTSNRSKNKGLCFYVHPDGERRCAVGRIVDEQTSRLVMKRADINCSGVPTLFREGGHLIDEYRKLESDVGFLLALQSLHDSDCFWTSGGFNSSESLRLCVRMNEHFTEDEINEILAEL